MKKSKPIPLPLAKAVQLLTARLARAQARLKALREPQAGAGDPPSRQLTWRQQQVEAGLCGQCGQEKIDPGSKGLGRRCLELQAARMKARRKKDGSKPS